MPNQLAQLKEKSNARFILHLLVAFILILVSAVIFTIFLLTRESQNAQFNFVGNEGAKNGQGQIQTPESLCPNSRVYKSLDEALGASEPVCILNLSSLHLFQTDPRLGNLTSLKVLILRDNELTRLIVLFLHKEQFVNDKDQEKTNDYGQNLKNHRGIVALMENVTKF